jgi:NADPH:quinone reductase
VTVRAVWLREFGGPEVLVAGEAPDPVPEPRQVLVDVAFANVTFVETQMRAGLPGPFKPDLPVIPGNGVGGIAAGRRVVGSTGGKGGYAERAVVHESVLYDVPDELGMDDAVALLADGRTATMLVRAAAPRPGETVLVEAAAGGVGSLLVQLARAAGATVVAAAGGERKLALARELGAARVVDYRAPRWEEGLEEIDVVFDGVGGGVARAAFGLLASGGRMVSFGLASGRWADVTEEEADARGVTLVRPARPTPEEQRQLTESALAEAAAGRLRPVIGQRFPLERAADAHAAIESRATIGKTLLELAPAADRAVWAAADRG